ncbi:hypothetical protein B0T16DRAFT_179946 [Cercophora newfieldiana]|uniref:Ankyrin n=1 Tax=Cercophora newfieldiana TaxID=92897 RepID=A0AA40CLW9_9PEZI|nr:hypothetical protein B0T16DRAFT_179946 [Cercophora newfieldiana]
MRFSLLRTEQFLRPLLSPTGPISQGSGISLLYLRHVSDVDYEVKAILSQLDALLSSPSPETKASALSIMLSLDKDPWPSFISQHLSRLNNVPAFQGPAGSSELAPELQLEALETALASTHKIDATTDELPAQYYECFGRYSKLLNGVLEKYGSSLTPLDGVWDIPLLGGSPLVSGALRSLRPPILAARDYYRRTRLHLALYWEANDDLLGQVVARSSGCLRDRFGFTPLHLAVILRRLRCIRELMTLNADGLEARCQNGKTALDYAIALGYTEIISVLRRETISDTITNPHPQLDGAHTSAEPETR